jgi:hypothetical protein
MARSASHARQSWKAGALKKPLRATAKANRPAAGHVHLVAAGVPTVTGAGAAVTAAAPATGAKLSTFWSRDTSAPVFFYHLARNYLTQKVLYIILMFLTYNVTHSIM